MKKWLLLVMMLLAAQLAGAQTFSEWFKQKKTQKKYLAQQIAALQVYKDYVKKGWKIAESGLNLIHGFTSGEFSLHQIFFASLHTVSSYIKDYPRIADIIWLESEVDRLRKKYLKEVRGDEFFSPQEVELIERTYGQLIGEVQQTLDDLVDVVSNGTYQMSDKERRDRIDRIYAESFDQYQFAVQFGEEAIVLAGQRRRQQWNIQALNGMEDSGE